MASKDIGLARTLARGSWFADSIKDNEWRALDALDSIASKDIEMARVVAGLPWFADGITSNEWRALGGLDSIASQDIELARTVASLPWFADGMGYPQGDAVYFLGVIASRDIELAKVVARLPWFAAGSQLQGLSALIEIANWDIELARMVARLPWFADGITAGQRSTLKTLGKIASKDIELAKVVATHSWFTDGDGMTADDNLLLSCLGYIASEDIELARMVASLPWVAGDVTDPEAQGVCDLWSIASEDIGLARRVASVTDGWRGNLRSYLFRGLSGLAKQGADVLGQLTVQPWFADGLSREEAAFVTAIGNVAHHSSTLYHDLLQAHFTQTRTVSLRLAGDVNIWVFQNTPFPPDEDLLTIIHDMARMSEGLLGVPFPTTDIILLVVDSDKRYGIRGVHHRSGMRLSRFQGKVDYLPHETAHYYFSGRYAPRWLSEGGANFMATLFNHRTSVDELADARASAFRAAQRCVDHDQMENIRHLTVVLANEWEILRPRICLYDMGEHFLHSASMIMGEEALMSALREVLLPHLGRPRHSEGEDAMEERIYETLLNHVSVDRQEDFRDLYRELHGGAAAFPDTDLSDDHGDEAIAATDVGVRQVVHGTLDYMFDFDYFRFRAQEGQKYRMNINHETLRVTSIGLYAPDGLTGENRNWESRDLVPTGPRIVWTAPSSEEYYLAVHNFGGKTGAYTLAITPVD